MGAAKRKRDLAGGLKRLQAGGQGLLGIEIVTPFHVSELGAKFLAGDNHAGPLLFMLKDAPERCRNARDALPFM